MRGKIELRLATRDGGHEQLISNGGRFKPAFDERDQCKPVLLGLSLARNLVKPLLSLYGTEWSGGSVAMDSGSQSNAQTIRL